MCLDETGVSNMGGICLLRSSSDIGDELHYIFTCAFFKNERKCCLPSFYQSKSNKYRFYKLLNFKTLVSLGNVLYICSLIMNTFKSSG